MITCTVQGTKYELLLDLNALEKFEETFEDGIDGAMLAMKGKKIKALRKTFVILANNARSKKGLPEDISEDAVKHATMMEVNSMATAIRAAEAEAFASDTVNGAADDDHHDDILDAMEAEDEKNGETGEG